MSSLLRSILNGFLFALSAMFTLGVLTYAAGNIPDSPIAGVPVGGMFMQYFNQMLVDTGVTTTGVVKNSAKTEQIATITNGSLAKWDSATKKLVDTPGVSLDGSNKLVVSSLQVSGGNNSDVMVSDSQGNVHWASVDSIISSMSGRLVECTPAKGCASQPIYPNALFTIGTPTSANQAWVQGALNCGYTCKSGWTGADCNTSVNSCKWNWRVVAGPCTVTGVDANKVACTPDIAGAIDYCNGEVSATCDCADASTPPSEIPKIEKSNIVLNDNSTMTDSNSMPQNIIIRLEQTITGGGHHLLACTQPISKPKCTPYADLELGQGDATGWSYNAVNDTYSISSDVSARRFPATTYQSCYLSKAGGDTVCKTWTPTVIDLRNTLTSIVNEPHGNKIDRKCNYPPGSLDAHWTLVDGTYGCYQYDHGTVLNNVVNEPHGNYIDKACGFAHAPDNGTSYWNIGFGNDCWGHEKATVTYNVVNEPHGNYIDKACGFAHAPDNGTSYWNIGFGNDCWGHEKATVTDNGTYYLACGFAHAPDNGASYWSIPLGNTCWRHDK